MERRSILRCALVAAAVVGVPAARAQTFPARPLRLVVPFPAGGPTDIFARKWAERASEVLGQSIVVDNRTGAGGTVGAKAVTIAAPDGYTLLFGSSSTHITSPLLMAQAPYDPVRDLLSIRVGIVPMFIVVRNGLPARTVPEFVDLLRSRPGAFTYASAGAGSINHLGGELLRREAGVDVLHVPYKGTGPAALGVAAGEIDFLLDTFATARPFHESGRFRILASCGDKRSATAPDVPTVAESGLPRVVVATCNFVAMPARTPAAVRDMIIATNEKVMVDERVLNSLASIGIEPVSDKEPVNAASAYVRNEINRWTPIAKASGASI